jgi:hypothetical protein
VTDPNSNSPKESLFNEAGDLFFRKGIEGRLLFRRDAQGKVDGLIDRRNNEEIIWRKIRNMARSLDPRDQGNI